MKKLKLILTTLLTFAAATCVAAFFGCGSHSASGTDTDGGTSTDGGNTVTTHTHSYSEGWNHDEDGHYKLCSCGDKSSYSAHTWNDGVTLGDTVTYTCTVCGATKIHTHSWGESVTVGDTVTYACTGCSATKSHTHTWDEGTVSSEVSCVQDGVTTYACTGCSATKTETVAALGHDTQGAAWQYNLTQHYQICNRCGNTLYSYDHAYDEDKSATVAATCTTPGERTLVCSICGYSAKETIEVVAHSYSSEWSHNDTSHWKECVYGCGTVGETAVHTWGDGVTSGAEVVYTCTVCAATKTEANHEHSYASEWSSDAASHWKACTYSGCSAASETAVHSWGSAVVITAATETTTGEAEYTCTVCGYIKTEVLAKLAHVHTYDTSVWKSDSLAHYHPSTCGHSTEYGNYTNHTYGTDVTKNSDGSVTLICTVCGYKLTTSESVYDGGLTDSDGNALYDGVLTADTYAAFNIGGTDKTYSFVIYGRSANGIYYKVFYYGSGTITLSYEYFYARGTKSEKATYTLTNGQSFTWYLETVDFPNVSFDITTDSDSEFCGVLGLVWYGEENPDSGVESSGDFTVGEQKTVEVAAGGSSYEFVAQYSGIFVITCGEGVVIYTDETTGSVSHGNSYTFTLEKGDSLSVDLYPEDWKTTTTTVLVQNA